MKIFNMDLDDNYLYIIKNDIKRLFNINVSSEFIKILTFLGFDESKLFLIPQLKTPIEFLCSIEEIQFYYFKNIPSTDKKLHIKTSHPILAFNFECKDLDAYKK